jgi:hypothetical protein
MMPRATFISLARVALVLAPLSLGLGACETLENLNPFDEQSKKTPLSGQRHAVFPEGVPGVQYNAPPTQPSNSNIQVMPEAQSQNPDAQTPTAPRGPAQNQSDDPWAGQRR